MPGRCIFRARDGETPIAGAWVVIAVLAIALATLLPTQSWSGAGGPVLVWPFPTDRDDWLDVVRNIGLFLPAGLALSGRGVRLWRIALISATLSIAVEILQSVVPGRDPSARDVVANLAGSLLGAASLRVRSVRLHVLALFRATERWGGRLWHASDRTAAYLSVLWAATVAAVLAAPGLLTVPTIPEGPFLMSSPRMDAGWGPLRIGGNGHPDGLFSGLIDDVRIYARARPAEAVRADMLQPVGSDPMTEPDLIAAFGFDDDRAVSTQREPRGQASPASGESLTGTATWVAGGRHGGAASFDGRSGGGLVIAAADAIATRDEITLEAWVFPIGQPAAESTVLSYDGAYFLRASSEGHPFQLAGGGYFGSRYEDARPAQPLRPETWTHLAMSYDGTTITLYVNGIRAARNARWSSHRATAVSVNGTALGPGLLDDRSRIRDALRGAIDLDAVIECGHGRRVDGPLLVVAAPAAIDVLELHARGTDLFVNTPTRAERLGLAAPGVRLPHALEPCAAAARLSLALTGPLPALRARIDGRPVAALTAGPGSAWAFLLPADLLPVQIARLCGLAWMAMLLAPFGRWARRHAMTVTGVLLLALAMLDAPMFRSRQANGAELTSAAAGAIAGAASRRRRTA